MKTGLFWLQVASELGCVGAGLTYDLRIVLTEIRRSTACRNLVDNNEFVTVCKITVRRPRIAKGWPASA